jgi:hypothetical protein
VGRAGVLARPGRWRAVGVLALAGWTRSAAAFDLDGHTVLEAAAYRRLLARDQVPGTDLSGRALLADLIAGGVLGTPRCFDGARPWMGGCRSGDRRDRPLAFWPPLHAGSADLVIDRQLSARAQCQHFMAETRDGLTPPDPRLGVPVGLATTAYTRCIDGLGAALDGLLRDPGLANHRLVGIYAVIHAVQDSFSPAHVARDERHRIVHLNSWTLLDWPAYFWRGLHSFPPATHHAITDDRDGGFLWEDGRTPDGRRCKDIHNGYAVPESCLTPLGRAAVDAVVDLLVLVHQVRARAQAAGREPSLSAPEDAAAWEAYVATHLPSVVAPFGPPPAGMRLGFPRVDEFLGVQGNLAQDGWGVGPWAARLFYGPATPFALLLTGGVGVSSQSGEQGLTAAAGIGLALPIVRRLSIGGSPVLAAVRCTAGFRREVPGGDVDVCKVGLFATLGDVIIPLPASLWLGIQGPRWSWDERAVRGPLVGLAVGWSHEHRPDRPTLAPEVRQGWDPPRPEEVRAYRHGSTSWLVFFSATARSTDENRWVSGGLELRRDLDPWDRRSGWSAALAVSVVHGTTDGSTGEVLALAPVARFYLVARRLSVAATPSLVRVGALAGESVGVDVGAQLSLALTVARVELSLESPPLSYVSPSRRHTLPVSLRLGLLFD